MTQAVNPYAAPAAQLTSGHKPCESCGALVSVAPWRQAIEMHYFDTRKLPAGAADLRKDSVPGEAGGRQSSVSLGPNGVLTVTMSSQTGALAGKTIVFQPDVASGAIRWDCTAGTLERRYRPASCRAQ